MLTWTYVIVLDFKGKHNFKLFSIDLPTRELTLTNLKFLKQGITIKTYQNISNELQYGYSGFCFG